MKWFICRLLNCKTIRKYIYFSDSPAFSLPLLPLFSVLFNQRCSLSPSLSERMLDQKKHSLGIILQRQQYWLVPTFYVVGYNINVVLELYFKTVYQYCNYSECLGTICRRSLPVKGSCSVHPLVVISHVATTCNIINHIYCRTQMWSSNMPSFLLVYFIYNFLSSDSWWLHHCSKLSIVQ